VREAYDQSMRRAETRRGEDYYWSKTQVRQSDAIEELRKVPLAEDYTLSLTRREVPSHREEGSTAKKVRSFFQVREDALDEKTKAKVAEAVGRAGGLGLKGGEVVPRVNGCLKIVNEFISTRLEDEVEAVIDDFEAAARFLSRCFSLTLTLQRPSERALSPAELLELVRIIDQKQMVPTRFTSPLSFVEISTELAAVREQITRLPNFGLGPAVLRMVLAIKQLRKEFPEEVISLAEFCREDRK
jgi:hypothetical protein